MKDLLPLPALPECGAGARIWVALSGGLDSTALLHRLARQAPAGLRAIHVHHGLQAAADDWARQVRSQCRELGVPLSLRRVRVAATGAGPEADARAARHAVFQSLLKPGDLLVTAHHLDDQAETVLLRALRGTGIEGLAAMPALAPYGRGRIWRPLLATPRTAIERYARQQGLAWVEDPHNRDPRYARSYLRHAVWPLLAPHWPQAGASLARLAQHAQEAASLLAELARQDAGALGLSAADLDAASALPIPPLLAMPAARRRNLLRWWWSRRGWPAPAAEWLRRLEREVLRARGDAQPCLPFAQGQARRYRGHLYLMPPLPPAPAAGTALAWRRGRGLQLPPGCGELRAARAPARPLIVRFAGGGERLKPAGAAHHRSLKQLCQRAGVPVWVRERLPLIYDGARLLSVAGVWNATELAELKGFAPRWHCELPGWPPSSV